MCLFFNVPVFVDDCVPGESSTFFFTKAGGSVGFGGLGDELCRGSIEEIFPWSIIFPKIHLACWEKSGGHWQNPSESVLVHIIQPHGSQWPPRIAQEIGGIV